MQVKKHFTFRNGTEILYTVLTPYFLGKLNRLAQRLLRDSLPVAPVVETDLGTTTNDHDPAYQAALATWYSQVGFTMFALAVQQGVEIPRETLDAAADTMSTRRAERAVEKAAFAQFAQAHGYTNEPNDFEAFEDVPISDPTYEYLLYVAADGVHFNDLIRLMNAMRGIGGDEDEQEAAVIAAAESFQGDASRQEYLEVPSAT